MKNCSSFLLIMRVLILSGLFFNQALGVDLKVEPRADTLHLEFSGQPTYQYQINKKVINGQYFVELAVPAFKEAKVHELEKLQNAFVKNIKINQQAFFRDKSAALLLNPRSL